MISSNEIGALLAWKGNQMLCSKLYLDNHYVLTGSRSSVSLRLQFQRAMGPSVLTRQLVEIL